ncbi:hypothetical protein XFF7767_770002 [Xanthomonas citri pv. fuscans]|nr:hypothetical protein XFF6960_270018 [Xanthomonas citri pv. fuscans]SOO06558.1 hypothetical protein XFF7767_770002 [Xanthomonas citri pv. fuscans]SOO14938.1 hypothetical protein XFF7766_440020 [Xanthomonas citri pv. fuscans]SOO44719.1 hypothetical protein XFF1815_600018 [Xanthomonas citri pv. fuscans]
MPPVARQLLHSESYGLDGKPQQVWCYVYVHCSRRRAVVSDCCATAASARNASARRRD